MFLALAALGAAPATAVSLSPNGVGQALLFPYYTVRSAGGNQYNTYISVTNTAADAVVAKVRFREGRNSRLVAEFNLYLAAGDMWTAALVPAGEGTRLVTLDKSCTNPALPAAGLDFSNASFAGGDDGAGTGLERTREGHFEFIEMATMPVGAGASLVPDTAFFNCAAFQGASPALGELRPPSRGLTGTATLINVNSGLDSTYAAEALANLTAVPFYSHPGAAGTDFDAPQVDPVSHATVGNVSYRMLWSRGIDAVNSVLMSEYVENEFVLDEQTLSRTDWVFAFPTRRFFVSTAAAQAPFSAPFGPSPSGGLTCEGIRGDVANREGSSGSLLGDFGVPPSPYRQCWSAAAFPVRRSAEAAIPVGSSDVLGAANTLGWTSAFLPIDPIQPWGGIGVPENFFNGRLSLQFDAMGTVSSLPGSSWVDLATGATGSGSVSLFGLPVAGFMVRTFENGTLSCSGGACQGNYASAMPHRRIMRILAAP
jgi:hypothetical protein